MKRTVLGNPINTGTGNKYQEETDYRSAGQLEMIRYYNSTADLVQNPNGGKTEPLRWTSSYSQFLQSNAVPGSTQTTSVRRADGRSVLFVPSGANWIADSDVTDKLAAITGGWQFTSGANDDVETYDSTGKLLTITSRAGLTQTLTYSDGSGGFLPATAPACNGVPGATAPSIAGLLMCVTDHFGRQLNFARDATGRISKMTNPDGGLYQYAYDGTSGPVGGNNLTSVTYPDSTQRIYHYNESANTSGASLPNALTGITDEKSVRYATFKYDTTGRSIRTEHAGSVDMYQVSYGTGTAQTTEPLGNIRTANLQNPLGVANDTSVAQTNGAGTGTATSSSTYDANGNLATRTDYNGNRTNYTFDLTRNLETSRTEGLTSGGGTTAATRTIDTAWHSTFRLPTSITEKNSGGTTLRTTSFTHDANGNVLTRTVSDGTNSRTWTYTYNANGSVLTADGPRTDLSDVTTYTYYANNATCTGASTIGCRGQVNTITNALSQVTTITDYNAHGQPLSITDPNGLVTTLAYDSRQRLTSKDVGGETTTYTYDNAGQLTRVTLPDTSYLDYTYDNAHRLTAITDNLGNKIAYTLDNAGNRTLEEVRDPGNTLMQTHSRVYNTLSRLFQDIGASSQTTSYVYDNQGNLTSIDGPLSGTGDTTTNLYDALNRLTRITDPNSGQVNYGLNPLDQLTSVSDPRSLTTNYTLNALDNLTQLASPDTGTTVNTHDDAGNVLTSTDAKSQATTYTYDALNRVATITYQGSVVHSYQYDQGTNGVGHLTTLTEPNSTTTYVYDVKGRLTTETRTINAIAYATGYGYDSAGRLNGVTYPSGRTVAYSFDSLGRISGITTTQGGTQTVVSSVTYHPFGGVTGFTFGNSQTYARSYDQDGRVSGYSLGSQSFTVGFDNASRITSIAEVGNPPNTNSYGYDLIDRITGATLPATTYGFTYDSVGNRLTKVTGANTDTYTPAMTSNQLASITPSSGPVRNYTHDANGSVTADGNVTYTYDTRGRLTQTVAGAVTTDYKVNAVGQRIRKTDSVSDTVYHYDMGGRLIAETDASGTLQREYIYLGDTPVAVLDSSGTMAYIHTDHLNTPRVITDGTQQVVWRWDQAEPFGTDAANSNPSGLGVFEFNLRLPGQYFDKETNLHYNYFRDYDPAVGRYVQSDPIGLEGGANTYSYVGSNPILWTDETGEFANFAIGAITGLVTGYAIAKLTGDECYGLQDAIQDAALGAVGAGVVSKLNKLYRIAKLRSIASERGLQSLGQRGYTETWRNGTNSLERLQIKHEAGKAANLEAGSNVPRFAYRIDAGKFWNPFTGVIGPKGTLSHLPLEPVIPMEASVAGAAAGAISQSTCGCNQ